MDKDLLKRINTTGAFDPPWLREQLLKWDVKKEQQKADFSERLYQVYKPENKCFTGLWERFALTEAALVCRDTYFETLDAIQKYELEKQKAS